jgi:UDP-glucose 4-epimerase
MIEGLGPVLVTGATGFIGSALVKRLAAEGNPAVCLVRAGSRGREKLEGLAGLRFFEMEPAADLAPILAEIAPDVVFHLAASGVRPDDREPASIVEGNVVLTTRLVAALAARPPRRFVFAGSCSEYAPIAEGKRIGEDHPLEPTSLYGAAKVSAYLCGKTLAAARGVPFVPLRLFGVFGPGEGPERLVPHLLAHFRAGETPELTPGEQARDFTYVEDVVDALIAAATSPSVEPFRAYNVCSGRATRVRDIALAAARAAGRPDADLGLGRRPYRPDEPMWIVGDPERFSNATGWRPRVGIDEGITRLADSLFGRAG